MQNQAYKSQVSLLLDVLPEVAKEKCFALHGGTAINLFVRDMPRLSVDIDLTYVELADRETSIKKINAALVRVAGNLTARNDNIRVRHRADVCKLQVSRQGVDIKVEVNLVGRGVIDTAVQMTLCNRAQDEFDAFVEFPVVPFAQLFGGKICAALDRQHPRDLFDVKYLLATEGISADVCRGFVYCLLGTDRPMNEVLKPNLQDQSKVMETSFTGMTSEPFSYEDFEKTRLELIETINA
jgi:predicted nucleotidyltransferase component of viral defense system